MLEKDLFIYRLGFNHCIVSSKLLYYFLAALTVRSGGGQNLDILEFQLNPDSGIQPQALLELLIQKNKDLFSHLAPGQSPTINQIPGHKNPGNDNLKNPGNDSLENPGTSIDDIATSTTVRAPAESDGIVPFLLGFNNQ